MDHLLKEVEHNISNASAIAPNISKATVGWQLYHILVTINVISSALQNSNPKDYKRDFNLMRSILFTFNTIPRGKAKAPKIVRPPEVIQEDKIREQIVTAKESVKTMNSLDKNAHFKHPYFGVLNVKRTEYFLKMHTNHHLKIVRDILKA